MKKQLLTGLFLSTAYILSAQTSSLHSVPGQKSLQNKYGSTYYYADSFPNLKQIQKGVIRPFTNPKPNIIAPEDNMPVAGKIPAPVFMANNGKELNLYQSPLDQMIIAEPDATFHSNMPTLTFQFENMPTGNFQNQKVPPGGK